MKILVVGGGEREHAIVRALARSAHAPELLCALGHAGIGADAECLLEVAADDVGAIVAVARERGVDLVVVGPEATPVAGWWMRSRALGRRLSGRAEWRPSWRGRRRWPRSRWPRPTGWPRATA